MQQLIKRIVSMLLVFCLLLNTMPLAAFATEMESTPESDPTVTEAAPTETTAPVEDSALLVLSDTLEAQPTTVEPASTETEPIETTTATETETEPTTVVTEPVTEPAAAASSEVSFSFNNGKITGCNPGSATEIVIPEQIDNVTVTEIGYQAFINCTGIVSVTIPDTVKIISYDAFKGCTALTTVNIPESVTEILNYSFSECTSLTSISIPGSVKELCDGSFFGCTSLTTAVLGEGLEVLGSAVFCDCSNLTSVNIPSSLTEIGGMAFQGTAISGNLTIPGNVKSIGGNAFDSAPITSVTFESGVQTIGTYSFSNCTSLTDVSIPESVGILGEGAFYNCQKLTSITIPGPIPEIGDNMFFYCYALTNVTLPDTVTSIGSHAFRDCFVLESVNIPDSVHTIETSAFFNCRKLKEINLPEGLTSLEDWLLFDCESLTELDIPDSVTYIGMSSIGCCSGLTEITIPAGVTEIANEAFRDCTGLKAIDIPDSVTRIGDKAFNICSSLSSVTIGDGVTEIGDSAFGHCADLSSVTIGGNVKTIGNQAFQYCYNNLTDVNIPNSVETIGTEAFRNCVVLANVTLPESVVSIGNQAFWECYELQSVWVMNPDMAFGSNMFPHAPAEFAIYGYSNSTAQTYANQNGHIFKNLEPRKLSVKLITSDSTEVTDGFIIKWYDEEDALVCEGTEFTEADAEKSYRFEITFEDQLAVQYVLPEKQTIAPGSEDASVVITLEAIPTLTLTGKAVNQAGNSIPNASVTVIINSTSIAQTAVTDSQGSFSLVIPALPAAITIRKDGYYSCRKAIYLSSETGGAYDLGSIPMTETISDRINMTVTLIPATEDPDTSVGAVLPTLETLIVHLTGSDGEAITGYEIQGSSLIFQPGIVSSGEQITVTLSDPRDEYISSSVSVVLDSNMVGSGEISLVQKGRLMLSAVTGCDATLSLYDSNNKNIWVASAETGTTSAPLSAGTYTLVLIEKNTLLRSVSQLSLLDTLGLTSGTDYLKMQVSIRNGVLNKLADCTVPQLDIDKLCYTQNHSVSVNKAGSIAPGELFMIRLEYTMDTSKGIYAQSLQAVLPEGIAPNGSIALLDGSPVTYAYQSSTRTVTIDTEGKTAAVAYLYCQAGTDAGDHTITGALSLSNGITQPIGTALAKVQTATLTVPRRTSERTVIASGKTAPNASITLYDNSTQVAKTTSNAAGSWSTELTLSGNLYTYSYHYIHAQIQSSSLSDTIITERKLVTYDERTATVKRVTMYNSDHYGDNATVFDFTTESTQVPFYRFNPEQPTFTFVAEIEGDAEISEVYVVTSYCEDKTYVPLQYDADSGNWVGSHDYTTDPPETVGVVFDLQLGTKPNTDQLYEDVETQALAYTDEILSMYSAAFAEELCQIYDEESQIGQLIYTDPETTEENVICQYRYETNALPDSTTAETLEASSYLPMDDTGSRWMLLSASGATMTVNFVDLTTNQSFSIISTMGNGVGTYSVNTADDFYTWWLGFSELKPYIVPFLEAIPGIGDVATWANLAADAAEKWNELWLFDRNIDGNLQTIDDMLKQLEQAIDQKCKDGTPIWDNDTLTQAKQNYLDLLERAGAYRNNCQEYRNQLRNLNNVGLAASLIQALIPGPEVKTYNMEDVLLGIDANLYSGLLTSSYVDVLKNQTESQYFSIVNNINDVTLMLAGGRRDCEPKEPEDDDPPVKPAVVEWDPSGFVYEAVPSNRLENVTATIYYRGSNDSNIRWNASDYDQINPQITDVSGSYRWDVLAGDWKVTFTKDGYEPADTSKVEQAVDGWLPVPPPQLNINVGMVSTAAPTVRYATAYTDQAELVFSQYMNIESVRNAVKLTRNGAAVSVTVKALDAEYDLSGEHQYATRFALIPTGGLTGSVLLSVSTGAKNYAGTALESAYTSPALTPEERPTELNGSDSVSIGTGEEVTIALTLQPCVPGKTLQVESLTPNLVSVLVDEVMTDENGRAIIRVKGNLPGSGRITVTEPISGLSKTITVDTQNPADDSTVQSVIATLEDGTVVTTGMTIPAGSRIILTTEDENAVIRYTLNNTCPCKEAALTYSEPILITGDTMLRAAACRDGVYSATIKISLKAEGCLGDFTGDGETTDADVAYLVWHLLFPAKFPITGTADFVGNDGVNLADAEYLLWHVLFPSVYSL